MAAVVASDLKRGSWLKSKFTRKHVTVAAGFTMAVVGITGVIFQFFFKNRILTAIHGWLGVALVVIACLHIAQNWKPLTNYLKDRLVLVTILPFVAWAGYLALMQTRASSAGGGRGAGGAVSQRMIVGKLTDAKTEDVARVFGKDSSAVVAAMQKDHLVVSSASDTPSQIAKDSGKTPEAVLNYFVK